VKRPVEVPADLLQDVVQKARAHGCTRPAPCPPQPAAGESGCQEAGIDHRADPALHPDPSRRWRTRACNTLVRPRLLTPTSAASPSPLLLPRHALAPPVPRPPRPFLVPRARVPAVPRTFRAIHPAGRAACS
jgi:hypothetical protein